MAVKRTVVDALKSKGITAESDPQEIKKQYFATAGHPLSKTKLPELLAALAGDESQIVTEEAPAVTSKAAAKAKKEKVAKAPKEPKTAETAEVALARLKADPKTAERYARVREVTEMGKRGPTRVTIVCDDKGPNGEELLRNIAVQDLFQVRFSAGYKRPRSKKASAPAATAPAAE